MLQQSKNDISCVCLLNLRATNKIKFRFCKYPLDKVSVRPPRPFSPPGAAPSLRDDSGDVRRRSLDIKSIMKVDPFHSVTFLTLLPKDTKFSL